MWNPFLAMWNHFYHRDIVNSPSLCCGVHVAVLFSTEEDHQNKLPVTGYLLYIGTIIPYRTLAVV